MNEEAANKLVDNLIKTFFSNDADEERAVAEWIKFDLKSKVTIIGIIAYITGHKTGKIIWKHACDIQELVDS